MNCRRLLPALILLGLIWSLQARAAETQNLYRTFLEVSEREHLLEPNSTARNADPAVLRFLSQIVQIPEGQIESTEIPLALSNNDIFCNARNWPEEELTFPAAGQAARASLRLLDRCPAVKGKLQVLAQREMRVRTLASDLRLIADSYERSTLGYDSSSLPAGLHILALQRMWTAGNGQNDTAPLVRSVDVEANNLTTHVETLAAALQSLVRKGDDDEQHAAVERYRISGVRHIAGERPDLPPPLEAQAKEWDGPGTERQYVFKRWDKVEEALMALWNSIKDTDIGAETENDLILVRLPESLQRYLPNGIQVWAYLEMKDGERTGDIGLGWALPQPSLPAICRYMDDGTCFGIPGGTYPPAPRNNTGLCTHPLARQGYLCRPFEAPAGDTCANALEPEAGKILLSSCIDPDPPRATISGPDACAEIDWRGADDTASQCTVDVECNDDSGVPGVYDVLRELTASRQQCTADIKGTPPDTLSACCSLKAETFRVACNAMNDDGLFAANDASGNGIPFNVKTCEQVSTDYACRSEGFGSCPSTFAFRTLSDGDEAEFLDELHSYVTARAEEKGIPISCEDTVEPASGNRDPRIDAMLRDISTIGNEVSVPGRRTEYVNSIGNNICYFSRSVEETLLKPAPEDTAFTAGGGASPALACVRPDPQFSAITLAPALRPWSPPAYRPAALLREFDAAACAGLAPSATPSICSFGAAQGFLPAQAGIAGPSANALAQQAERFGSAQEVTEMADAWAARIATRTFADYLEQRMGYIADTFTRAADLLQNFTRVQFPSQMCPLNDAGGTSFLQTPLCSAEPPLDTSDE